jgi:hypothetical protein
MKGQLSLCFVILIKTANDRTAINAEVVPANTRGIAVTPNSHPTNTAVDKKHGTTKSRRKGPGSDERA